jgi:hypothetical protein
MVDSVVFIGLVIIAVTQAVKIVVPKINGAVTIIVAVLVGAAVALLDTHIGVADVTVAQGVMIALAAVGVHTTASQIG